MKLTEIVRVDNKGRITIPMVVREALGIVEGMHIILIADSEKREILLSPLLPPKAALVEISLKLHDIPGALATVTGELAELNVDLIASHCTTIKRGELAECTLVADISKLAIPIDKLREKLAILPVVKYVSITHLRRIA